MATPHHLPKKRNSPKSTQRSLFFKRHFCGLSQSDVSTSPFVEESDSASQASEDEETPFARHGPVLEAGFENIDMQRDFWSPCVISFILDYRKFSISNSQQLINNAWQIRGVVTVSGRDSFFYLIHFEHVEDLKHICVEGTWAIDGAFLILEKWGPNLVLNRR